MTAVTVVPTVTRPVESLSLEDKFLVSARLQVQAATAERQACIEERGPFGISMRTDPTIATVNLKDFSDSERRYLSMAMPHLQAQLYLAGAEYAPKDPIPVSEVQPAYWSIRATSPGKLTGWVSIESRSKAAADTSTKSDLQLDIKSAEGTQTFSTTIGGVSQGLTYVLSVVGSILGTLLASLPAWLAWYDKRRAERTKAEAGRIILP